MHCVDQVARCVPLLWYVALLWFALSVGHLLCSTCELDSRMYELTGPLQYRPISSVSSVIVLISFKEFMYVSMADS
jgi:hypothetical protein